MINVNDSLSGPPVVERLGERLTRRTENCTILELLAVFKCLIPSSATPGPCTSFSWGQNQKQARKAGRYSETGVITTLDIVTQHICYLGSDVNVGQVNTPNVVPLVGFYNASDTINSAIQSSS